MEDGWDQKVESEPEDVWLNGVAAGLKKRVPWVLVWVLAPIKV